MLQHLEAIWKQCVLYLLHLWTLKHSVKAFPDRVDFELIDIFFLAFPFSANRHTTLYPP